jgi:hypothetical protein
MKEVDDTKKENDPNQTITECKKCWDNGNSYLSYTCPECRLIEKEELE